MPPDKPQPVKPQPDTPTPPAPEPKPVKEKGEGLPPEAILAELTEGLKVRGHKLDNQVVALASRNIDVAAQQVAARERVSWEIWDQKSPVNGVKAKDIKARDDYVGGEVYLVTVDDVPVVLQPHDPGSMAPLTKDTVENHAKRHAAQFADEMVRGAAARQLESSLAAAGLIQDLVTPVIERAVLPGELEEEPELEPARSGNELARTKREERNARRAERGMPKDTPDADEVLPGRRAVRGPRAVGGPRASRR